VGTTNCADPSLTSPVTYLDCKRYSKALIRMRAVLRQAQDAQVQEATGQLFWSTTEHGTSEARSVTFKVLLDGKWHDYALDLKSKSNWKGLTDRLRFDPVDVAGVRFTVDEIKIAR
jgi:hypothetical protein